MIKSIPNILSWSRIALAPLITVFYFLPGYGPLVAVVLFTIAGLTDYADGKIAREFKVGDDFGVFLDPVADKILVVTVLLTMVAAPEPVIQRELLVLLAALVILREVVQSALRDWMSQVGKTKQVAVTGWSKTKTLLQMIALGVMLGDAATVPLGLDWNWLGPLGATMLAVAAALGLFTLAQFLYIAVAARGSHESPKVPKSHESN